MIRTSFAATVACEISCLLLVATTSSVANAAEIKVLSAAALKPAMSELIPQFENSSGHKVTIDYGTAREIADRIQKGEVADVAILTQQLVENLEKQARIVAGTPVEIGKVGVGLFMRKGAPKPDISSVEALKRTLLAAKSIGHVDPATGGPIGVYVVGLLGRLDIAADIKPKIRVFPPYNFDTVANGDIEIAFASITEILADSRVEFVGPLPAAIQSYTVVGAGVVASGKERDAGQALIQFLTSPAAADVWKATGRERP